jgi:ABC-type phosphonate transport system ATPase subunit
MSQYARIVVDDLSKVFGGKVRAVDRLSFTVEPGSVTGAVIRLVRAELLKLRTTQVWFWLLLASRAP